MANTYVPFTTRLERAVKAALRDHACTTGRKIEHTANEAVREYLERRGVKLRRKAA